MPKENPLMPSGRSAEQQSPSRAPAQKGSRRADTVEVGESGRRSLAVSFDDQFAQTARHANSQLKVSFSLPPERMNRRDNRSPLIPYDVLSPQTQKAVGGAPSFETRAEELEDPSSAAVLIYPKPIDNLRRFRMLFVGLLMFIVSSTQGVHSLFGTLFMQQVYGYNVKQMTSVYLCGSSFGMFVWVFGALYDCFGPRPVIAVTTLIVALGELLLGLMFAGHIQQSVTRSCLFYAIMSWGCYGLDVVTLPTVLTHVPRNRGNPTGLLKTFSGLGSSLLSCLFRGFFNDHYDHLMWFMCAFTLVFGAIGTWYLEDAPYVANRWQQRKLTPRKVLRNYLIRNRYMSQFLPRRRYSLVIIVMVILNFYLTIQAIVVAFKEKEMTEGKKRGVAIGAILATALILILIVPIRAIDGISPQDKEVIERAKQKEEELERRRTARRAKAEQEHGGHRRQLSERQISHNDEVSSTADSEHASEKALTPVDVPEPHTATKASGALSTEPATYGEAGGGGYPSDTHVEDLEDHHEPRQTHQGEGRRHVASHSDALQKSSSADLGASPRHKGSFSFSSTWRRTEPVAEPRPVVEMLIEDDNDDNDGSGEEAEQGGPSAAPADGRTAAGDLPLNSSHARGHHQSGSYDGSPRLSASFAYAPHREARGGGGKRRSGRRGGEQVDSRRLSVSTRDPSTYDHPYFEYINICGEVFVTPVYQTTFFESLTYVDLWCVFYTTMVVWGIGLTMTANWNIQVMVQARWVGMDYKMYVVIAAMSGIATAGGRVFVGVYEQLLELIRNKCGVDIVSTVAYPLASVGMLLGMIFWIALPGDKVLVLAYLVGPAFYGFSTSFTPYLLGTIFDRDMGMHYGFVFFGAGIGQVLFFYLSWFLTYDDAAVMIPMMGKRCLGQRKCMNKAIGIYIALIFSSIFTSLVVHLRYARMVAGNLRHRRVIKRAVKRTLGLTSSDEADDSCGSTDDHGEAAMGVGSSSTDGPEGPQHHSDAVGSRPHKEGRHRTADRNGTKGNEDNVAVSPRDETPEAARRREPVS